eukprot:521648-Hanusia_phi.AAC.1
MSASDVIVVGKGKQEGEDAKLPSVAELPSAGKAVFRHRTLSFPRYSPSSADKVNGTSRAGERRPSEAGSLNYKVLSQEPRLGNQSQCRRQGEAERRAGYVKLSWFELPASFDSMRKSSVSRRAQARAESVK